MLRANAVSAPVRPLPPHGGLGLVFARGLGDAVRERGVVPPDAGFRQVRYGGDAAQLLAALLGE
jgi:hypothetical protein